MQPPKACAASTSEGTSSAMRVAKRISGTTLACPSLGFCGRRRLGVAGFFVAVAVAVAGQVLSLFASVGTSRSGWQDAKANVLLSDATQKTSGLKSARHAKKKAARKNMSPTVIFNVTAAGGWEKPPHTANMAADEYVLRRFPALDESFDNNGGDNGGEGGGVNVRECSNALLQCDIVIDPKCGHPCENMYFHALESCLVPIYSLLAQAREAVVPRGTPRVANASTLSARAPTKTTPRTCVVYDEEGYLGTSGAMNSLLLPLWTAAAEATNGGSFSVVPFRSHWPLKGNGCWDTVVPVRKRASFEAKAAVAGPPQRATLSGLGALVPTKTLKKEDICFRVRPKTAIMSWVNNCGGSCRLPEGKPSIELFRSDVAQLWGAFHKQRTERKDRRGKPHKNGTLNGPGTASKNTREDLPVVVLIVRGKSERRESRHFSDSGALESALRADGGFDVRVYNGSFPTMSTDAAYMFGSADVVLGYHGAGFTNIIYSDQGTAFIEMFVRECDYSTLNVKRLSGWGRTWIPLAVGSPSQPNPPNCKYVNAIVYNETDLDLIVQAVNNALESVDI